MTSGGGTIVSEKVLMAVCGAGMLESCTVMVTELTPAATGVPVICPVEALIVKPAGSPVADQVYGCMPPAAMAAEL